MASMLPVGTVPIVPDTYQDLVQSAVGSAGADRATKSNLATLAKHAVTQVGTDMDAAIADSGTKLSWGFLRPVAAAIDAGAKSVLGKSFNLTSWTGG